MSGAEAGVGEAMRQLIHDLHEYKVEPPGPLFLAPWFVEMFVAEHGGDRAAAEAEISEAARAWGFGGWELFDEYFESFDG